MLCSRRDCVTPWATVLAFALAGAVQAQSLAEVARKEQERRKRQAPSGKTFTNDDLSGDKATGKGAFTQLREPAAGPAGSASKPAAQLEPEKADLDREQLEREWRQRFAQARRALKDAESRAFRDVVRTEFYQGIPVQMKVREFVETEELRQARGALADLEEELRRAGLPPGWGREPSG